LFLKSSKAHALYPLLFAKKKKKEKAQFSWAINCVSTVYVTL
jgi:hypothetical protein